jgi:hypothetical protein
MELSIIITSYKNPELLKLCLDSVRKNLEKLDYELIVADSATDEDTSMLMREDFPDVKFFSFRENVGFQALLKKGIGYASGKYILCLNADIIVEKTSIQELLAFVSAHPDMGMVGPKLLNFNGTLQPSCFRFYRPITILYRRTILGKFGFAKRHLDWFLMKEYDHEKPKEVDWLMGSALMVSRKAIEKVGLMDPRFFMYMEDVDWCRRFWENGYKVVYFPVSVMFHFHGKGSGRAGLLHSIFFNRLTWIHIFSAIKYFKKYWGKPVPEHK